MPLRLSYMLYWTHTYGNHNKNMMIHNLSGLALADRQFVISERISQMTKGNVTAFVNLTKALKRLIYSKFINVLETNCL